MQMYGQPGPGQTFSPGGSLEGSPLHHPHPQQYYNPDGTPQHAPMGAPAPGSAAPHGAPMAGSLPPMTSGAGGPPTSIYNPPGGFPTGGQMTQPPTFPTTTTQYQGPENQFQPTGAPPMPPQGYVPPGAVDYSQGPYNMQGTIL